MELGDLLLSHARSHIQWERDRDRYIIYTIFKGRTELIFLLHTHSVLKTIYYLYSEEAEGFLQLGPFDTRRYSKILAL